MNSGFGARVGDVNPDDAWRILEDDPNALLVDVRTRAEWGFVGMPDLRSLGSTSVMVEWARFPDMAVTPHFASAAKKQLDGRNASTLLFLCRSGVRSKLAAEAVMRYFRQFGDEVECLNIAEGFEGDMDENGHRGNVNGWKARGLAWRQT